MSRSRADFYEWRRELLRPRGVLYIKVSNARWSIIKPRMCQLRGPGLACGTWNVYKTSFINAEVGCDPGRHHLGEAHLAAPDVDHAGTVRNPIREERGPQRKRVVEFGPISPSCRFKGQAPRDAFNVKKRAQNAISAENPPQRGLAAVGQAPK